MEEKVKNKIICSLVIAFFIICSLSFFSISQVRFDHNNVRIEGFYKEEKNSLDVVFIGASEVYSDYYPVYAYEKYGYTSYNYAIEDNPLVFYKWELDEINSFQNPKLAVIELSEAVSESEMNANSGYFDATLRKLTDSTPAFGNKAELINNYGNKKHELSYYFPLLMYHTAKPQIETAKEIIGFQSRGYSYLKGAVTHTRSKECTKEELYNLKGDNSKQPVSKNQEKILLELLEHCKTKNYNVLFTRFPHRVENKEKYRSYCEGNYIAELVRGYGFDYLDCEHVVESIGIDRIEDFTDGEHLRAQGAKKLTEYIANVIIEKHNIIESKLTDSNKEKWNNSVKYMNGFFTYYEQMKNNQEDCFIYENNDLLNKIDE